MEEMKDDTVWIVKYHYLIMDQVDWSPYKEFIYTFDMNYDISLLYLVADMLVTDYSSVMFDYSILRRPILFYCYDLDEYMNTLRGFYFDLLKEAPGPVVTTSEDLIKTIREYDNNLYNKKYEEFIDKYNHIDDGKASGRVVDLICKSTIR